MKAEWPNGGTFGHAFFKTVAVLDRSIFFCGSLPPLDRIDYIDHAVAILERRHVYPTRPVLPEIRAYLRGDPFRNWSQEVQVLSALSELIVADHKRYPARFFYSWETGAIGSNDEAVAFLQGRALQIDIDLIVRALHCRNQEGDLKSLFGERSKLLPLRDMCKQLIATEE